MTIMLAKIPVIILAFSVVSGCSSQSSENLTPEQVAAKAKGAFKRQPGQWKETVQIVNVDLSGTGKPEEEAQVEAMMKGLGGMAMPKETCVTEADADKGIQKMIDGLQDSDCTGNKFSNSGGNVEMTMACKGKDGSNANLSIKGTFSPTKSDAEVTVDAAAPQGEQGKMVMTMKTSAERLGDCK